MFIKNFKNVLTTFFVFVFSFFLLVENASADLGPSFTVENMGLGIEHLMFALIALVIVIAAIYVLMKSRKKNDGDNNK